MTKALPLDEITQKLFAILPASVQNLESGLQQQFREILQAAFAHFDLVTREEFDVQTRVLAKTREKVEQLQAQVEALEQEK
ncbi:Membrane fusogenic activity [Legionella geestiana]|uniref:Ubiquinone biosynthesis accessory factor UbiK n=1 Tax=Legionella geestiana TaxID=45065 RepID=A0A0W0TUG5_9GAMM|nr:accessory factor UbiK family protein [Legionella geestiana]KTC99002.1 Membrane fusogenic activity [Legionella geestiana]QBS12663.1 accessory factor UbiK family protein [Legionella geestiana]QDQ39619.1 accessory factor UbiK family protein [Legionella geestiana]STX54874.1 Uncharacterized protein conserved in bacteria [Legionella geestiana]